METDYNNMAVVELTALVKRGLRGYSRLRKAQLIAFLWDNLCQDQDPGLDKDLDLSKDLGLQEDQGMVRDLDQLREMV